MFIGNHFFAESRVWSPSWVDLLGVHSTMIEYTYFFELNIWITVCSTYYATVEVEYILCAIISADTRCLAESILPAIIIIIVNII